MSLFGNLEGDGNDLNDGVRLQIDLKESLSKSHQLVEESLQIGTDVLLSFDR
jgi:hypothetical protein